MIREAIVEAQRALARGEVPVGAVVACRGRIIARAHNMVETLNDPTAHAEMQAITAAANALGGKYLGDCTMYVTLEPCPMCAAAMYNAHLGELVYGASDTKRGYRTISPNLLHPKTTVQSGILEEECAALMKLFFRELRKKF
ncbi:tRNA-specific adenosine-34 deaminase [Mucinivorans hirudinis]|uniref:tRNA-specific adenosine deaminase n=1 Tax=Mucinivorans hirudinis TaxID=1433126 RepID=A0A060RAI5_9BACT|nr:tRNA-specific adenosine-34 deaminase [Mucinivorans hirudinis]